MSHSHNCVPSAFHGSDAFLHDIVGLHELSCNIIGGHNPDLIVVFNELFLLANDIVIIQSDCYIGLNYYGTAVVLSRP